MRAVKQDDDRGMESRGCETPTLSCEPVPGETGDSRGDAGPSEVLPEADDRALEEAGYGHGV